MSEIDKDLISPYEQKMYIFSIHYLKGMKVKRRKINSLVRMMIKSLIKVNVLSEETDEITEKSLNNLNFVP